MQNGCEIDWTRVTQILKRAESKTWREQKVRVTKSGMCTCMCVCVCVSNPYMLEMDWKQYMEPEARCVLMLAPHISVCSSPNFWPTPKKTILAHLRGFSSRHCRAAKLKYLTSLLPWHNCTSCDGHWRWASCAAKERQNVYAGECKQTPSFSILREILGFFKNVTPQPHILKVSTESAM